MTLSFTYRPSFGTVALSRSRVTRSSVLTLAGRVARYTMGSRRTWFVTSEEEEKKPSLVRT